MNTVKVICNNMSVLWHGVKGYKATEEKIKKMELWSVIVVLGGSENRPDPVQQIWQCLALPSLAGKVSRLPSFTIILTLCKCGSLVHVCVCEPN